MRPVQTMLFLAKEKYNKTPKAFNKSDNLCL